MEYYLKEPGKGGESFTHQQSIVFLESGDIVQGANMIRNEYGRKQFANFFFFITGFHGFHVFSGVIINFVIFYNVLLGTYEKGDTTEWWRKLGYIGTLLTLYGFSFLHSFI